MRGVMAALSWAGVILKPLASVVGTSTYDRAGHLHEVAVADPVRRRDDDLVAGADGGGQGVVQRVLGAVGDDDLLGRDLAGRRSCLYQRAMALRSSAMPAAGV